jgi:small subunit ribosomal protein S4
MNKLNSRNKICLRTQQKVNVNLKFDNFHKKKWKLLKKKKDFLKIKKKLEEKKKFFRERLNTKQQLKFFYGCLPEYQIKNLFKSIKEKKNIIEKFLILLESRIDIILFRLNISKSIFHSKQLINHGKIKVNNKIIKSQNIFLKKGDIISIENTKKLNKSKLNYIEVNNFLKNFIFLRKPFISEIEYPFYFNKNLIYEYLNK